MSPALIGFQAVIERAQAIEQFQDGDMRRGPIEAMVGLPQPTPCAPGFDCAALVNPIEGALLECIGTPTEVSNRKLRLCLWWRLPLGTGRGVSITSITTCTLVGPKPATSHTSS
jgi:hypothetical protein